MYFKVTNLNEIHYGFKYEDGLNSDINEFRYEGSCVKGGLYFTKLEYIHNFFNYGHFVREITLPESDPDFKMVKDPDGYKWRANKIILGQRYTIFKFLKAYKDKFTNKDLSNIIHWAISMGRVKIVKFILGNTKFKSKDIIQESLLWPCVNGGFEMVKFLVNNIGIDIHIQNDLAFICACKYGHFEIVKFLVKSGAIIDENLKDKSIVPFEIVKYLEKIEN